MREMSVFNAYLALSGAYDAHVVRDEPLARHTTYRIGGPAALYVEAHTHAALSRVLGTLTRERVPWVVLGRGSNVLVSDAGYEGCVVRLGRDFATFAFDGSAAGVTAGAAASLPRLVAAAQTRGLSGLECCAGVPGSVGGAVSMDAGTRREWVGRSVESVVTMRADGRLSRHDGADVEWGYRSTSLPADEVVLEVSLALVRRDRASVAAAMEGLLARRRASQPVGAASCGSVFRNPPGHSAAELIESCGLSGHAVGHAVVSTRHANFIVNEGGATASDVMAVIDHVRDAVSERFGIVLQTEVKYLGF